MREDVPCDDEGGLAVRDEPVEKEGGEEREGRDGCEAVGPLVEG